MGLSSTKYDQISFVGCRGYSPCELVILSNEICVVVLSTLRAQIIEQLSLQRPSSVGPFERLCQNPVEIVDECQNTFPQVFG